MDLISTLPGDIGSELATSLERHWGIRELRPLQEPAIHAVFDRRDSLVVMPTGGGKSLCYQAPAVVQKGLTIVVSPLISLMKDQVDGLRGSGVKAVRLDSSLTAEQRTTAERDVRLGNVSLLFVSPERLISSDLIELLAGVEVTSIAIDEAHCISQWGHDFRPEYRQLRMLREVFPRASFHAYTATATERVRQDILQQLELINPVVLIGNFDRSNLTYRVIPRRTLFQQVLEVIKRHNSEGGIVYCISRADVDSLSAQLTGVGVKAMPYHAGMTAVERTRTQEAFLEERCDVVVATVAFGMGIDRSNVRYVIHGGMPKSLEHYQQETGRAGRDGLEAECILFHSGQDFFTWKGLMEKNARESQSEMAHLEASLKHLNEMWRYCRGAVCRHRALVNYFGQGYEKENCGACDHCLGETVRVDDAQMVAQKILSCVARLKGDFGIGHIVSVLRGEDLAKIRDRRHNDLSTYGIMREYDSSDIRDWAYQLIGHGVLAQREIQSSFGRSFSVVRLNSASLEVMKGQREVLLLQPTKSKKDAKAPAKSRSDEESWTGVDRELFEQLRQLRKKIADARGMPPYIVFHDSTLRELARILPSSPDEMRGISGVGDAKLRDFGDQFLDVIRNFSSSQEVAETNRLDFSPDS